jgi:hypothetical protein
MAFSEAWLIHAMGWLSEGLAADLTTSWELAWHQERKKKNRKTRKTRKKRRKN